jgi:hypothetical protein
MAMTQDYRNKEINTMKTNQKTKVKLRRSKKILHHCVAATLIAAESHAALIHPLNDLKVIEAPISQLGLTRITVKGDRISNVFGVAGEYVMEPDEDQGQVFIRPLGAAMGPISLTLTTEDGRVQDLRLVPNNQMPEAIVLESRAVTGGNSQTLLTERIVRNNTTRDDTTRGEITCDEITRDEIEDLLLACSEGRIPVGYKNVALDLPDSDEEHRLISEIKNGKLRGLTYEVKNLASIPWILSESGFAQKLESDVVAVLMPQKLLNPGERMHVYVAAKSI